MNMQMLKDVFDALYAPQQWLLAQSPLLSLTLVGLCLMGALALAGFVLARLGHKPFWALLLVVPTLNIVALWVLALRRFPREGRR